MCGIAADEYRSRYEHSCTSERKARGPARELLQLMAIIADLRTKEMVCGSPEYGFLFLEVPWWRSYVTVRGSRDEPVPSLWENVVALPGSIPHGWCV